MLGRRIIFTGFASIFIHASINTNANKYVKLNTYTDVTINEVTDSGFFANSSLAPEYVEFLERIYYTDPSLFDH